MSLPIRSTIFTAGSQKIDYDKSEKKLIYNARETGREKFPSIRADMWYSANKKDIERIELRSMKIIDQDINNFKCMWNVVETPLYIYSNEDGSLAFDSNCGGWVAQKGPIDKLPDIKVAIICFCNKAGETYKISIFNAYIKGVKNGKK